VSNRFEWPVRVYYEDTDAGGVVYHSRYLNFLERARTEWLRSMGFEQDELARQDNVIFVVRHLDVDFLRPARFNELLSVTTRVLERRRVSLLFHQEICRDADRSPLCAARVKVACLDAARFRPCPLPASLLTEIMHEF
jgi:acyl-CoA thioester hydrolase